ncbi:DNA polymerase I [compost metagenome]
MILLVDGNNIAYRAFHTPQGSLTTKQGEPTGVMLGVLNSLKGYLEKFPETTRVVVVWDGGKAKWRKELYPEYKSNRSYGEDPEEKAKFDGLFQQIDTLHEFLPDLGVHSIKLKGWEADDIIAKVCGVISEASKKVDHIMLVTSDKDMLQLVGPRVSVYTPYKDKIISPLNFYEETGVTQDAYLGYRALVGDTSDNISGVSGIGEKTAKNLMDTYGHIDNILGSTGDTKAKLMKSKRTAKIFDPVNLNILARNNKIMNFKYVPDDPTVEEAVYRSLGQNDAQVIAGPQYNAGRVKQFFTRWQFISLLTNYLPFAAVFMALGED